MPGEGAQSLPFRRRAAAGACLTEATGGAPPAYVARGPVVWVWASGAATALAVWMLATSRSPGGEPNVAWLVTASALLVVTGAAWRSSRRPRVVLGGLGVWLAGTLEHPPEVHPWSEIAALVRGKGRTRRTREHFLGVRVRELDLEGVSADVRAAMDGTVALDSLLPGTGGYLAELMTDAQRLRVRTVRRGSVRPGSGLERAVAAVAPGVPVERPAWVNAQLASVVTRSLWTVARRRR